ncbi:peptide MFS transporter [Lysobacter solisilvae (ex Woo and Kim 2020)]|uniref:MFS transporter n=1 Tax=Agrilutibacter terrestris TaxID=2865112 RepID=A0A7H0FYJ7_9GAMM|nr:oligopeptide:H+ symporter [Lysobacter terrestris]QNP41113.1 MFS transporter [Lysobacter terrestris]
MSVLSTAAAGRQAAAVATDDFLGHPKGVYVCFFTEMWERFSFYGMKALLLLFLLQHHKFGDRAGLDVLGAYGGLVYCVPVIGGLLADRFLGMRKAVIFGGLLLVAGHAGMAFEGHAATTVNGVVVRDEGALRIFYLSLALIIMGVGFLKPNVSTIVGQLYAENDPRRDSGFSLFVAGINLGALFASIVCGYLGQTLGWRYGFGAAGIGMLLGLAQFIWGRKYLRGVGEPPAPLPQPREWSIYGGALLGLLPVAWLMHAVTSIQLGPDVVRWTYGIVVMALAGIVWSMWHSWRRDERNLGLAAYVPSLLAFALLGAVVIWLSHRYGVLDFFIEESTLALVLMSVVFLVVGFWYVGFVTRGCSKVEAQRMGAMMVLIFAALVFYTLYEQTYGSWVTFTDRLLTKDIAPSLVQAQPAVQWGEGWLANLRVFMASAPWSTYSLLLGPVSFVVAASVSDRNPASPLPRLLFGATVIVMLLGLLRDAVVLPQTAGSLTYLGALFIVLLAPLFSVIWAWLDRRGLDPSKPTKSAMGLFFGGLSFLPLVWAAQHAGATGAMASVWWLVLAYLLLELGEMCLYPVGLSAVTQLSVPRVVSLMMGTWFLATAFSETLAALFGKLAAIDVPEGETMVIADAAAKYADLFNFLMWLGIGCAVVALLASPLLRRMMHGVK